jgi:hypothetical protein
MLRGGARWHAGARHDAAWLRDALALLGGAPRLAVHDEPPPVRGRPRHYGAVRRLPIE